MSETLIKSWNLVYHGKNKVAQVNDFFVLYLCSSRAQVVFCLDTQLRMQLPGIVLIHVFVLPADQLGVLPGLVKLLH